MGHLVDDTSMMQSCSQIMGEAYIQFIVKNVLKVHNREHPKKRLYVNNEKGKDLTEQRKSNNWYKVASEYSKYNSYNLTYIMNHFF